MSHFCLIGTVAVELFCRAGPNAKCFGRLLNDCSLIVVNCSSDGFNIILSCNYEIRTIRQPVRFSFFPNWHLKSRIHVAFIYSYIPHAVFC